MAAGLKADDGCVDAIELVLRPAHRDGRRLGMGGACALMGRRSDDIASRIEQHATDGGIGRRRAGLRPRDIKGEARRSGQAVNRIIHMD
jgi:hypothetical protein